MPVEFRILPSRGLVFVRYGGHVHFDETRMAFAEYIRHSDMRPGQKQLIDLTNVTGWDRDFAGLLKLQAQKADALVGSGHEVLLVYCAPSEPARQMARMVLRSWDDVPAVVPLVLSTEADALEVLGQPENSFNALLQSA